MMVRARARSAAGKDVDGLPAMARIGWTPQHDWVDTVELTGFPVLVLIDRSEGTLALVVASDD